jgi:serine-protein kinase ATM
MLTNQSRTFLSCAIHVPLARPLSLHVGFMSSRKWVLEITSSLHSNRINERKDGLNKLEELLSSKEAMRRVDKWSTLTEALFACIDTELSAVRTALLNKKPDKAPSARLTGAAEAFRRLCERAVKCLGKGDIQKILEHAYTALKNARQPAILQNISPPYLKGVDCLLSYRPHVESLEEQKWLEWVQISVNVLLDDKIGLPFQLDAEEPSISSDESDGCHDGLGKRRSKEPEPKPPSRVHARRVSAQAAATSQQSECTNILCQLLSSPQMSKFESPDVPILLLRKFSRLLVRFTPEATFYNDFIPSILSVLQDLSLNMKQAVVDFSRACWDDLLTLWGNKNKHLKECLTALFYILLPYYSSAPPDSKSRFQESSEWFEGVRKLWQCLNSDERWGTAGLSLRVLRLEPRLAWLDDQTPCVDPLVAQTFRLGYECETTDTLLWAVFELQADCTELVRSYPF